MNLALKEVRRHPGRFAGTSIGMALLFTVVLAMAGIYEGLVDDATVLVRSVGADIWVVQKGTRGPFADGSRLDPSVEGRIASVPGVRRARSFTHQVLERRKCVLDAGNNGIIMTSDHFLEPRDHAWLIPGPEAHWAKLAFEKYFLATHKRGQV